MLTLVLVVSYCLSIASSIAFSDEFDLWKTKYNKNYKDVISEINAYNNWKSDNYFRQKMGNQKIKVYSDLLTSNTFAPFDDNMKILDNMTMNQFLDIYNNHNRIRNYYYAEREIPNILQNDLINKINNKLIPPWIEFMENSLNVIKIWYGNNTNSLPHTDGYENLLFVFDGKKEIKLVDPTRRKYVYAISNYSPINFFNPDFDRFPLFKKAYPLTVTVNKGDILYIPSLWFHHIVSHDKTIATSMWFQLHSQLYFLVANCLEKNICT